jgi:hypothetical protein
MKAAANAANRTTTAGAAIAGYPNATEAKAVTSVSRLSPKHIQQIGRFVVATGYDSPPCLTFAARRLRSTAVVMIADKVPTTNQAAEDALPNIAG